MDTSSILAIILGKTSSLVVHMKEYTPLNPMNAETLLIGVSRDNYMDESKTVRDLTDAKTMNLRACLDTPN